MTEQQCLWCGGYCVDGMEGVCRSCWEEPQFGEQEVCIWKRSENPRWYWKTACGDWFDDISREYCSCGNRIVYKDGEW